ncbi:MAG: DNA polymerase III subunit alpha [Candidatus Wallbacteria bacterium]
MPETKSGNKEFIQSYVPLKCQTHYSVMRSIIKVDQLVSYARSNDLRFIGMCDLNNVSGFYEFYSKCRNSGIKPIIGVSVDVCDNPENIKNAGFNYRVTLFCKNKNGLKNVFKILNSGYLREPSAGGFYVDTDTVLSNSGDLICAMPAVMSFTYKLFKSGKTKNLDDYFKKYIDSFGGDRIFYELWKDGIPAEDESNLCHLEMSKKNGIRTVAVNNCQYINPRDFKGYAAAYAMRNSVSFNDALEKLSNSARLHIKSAGEMSFLFSHIKGAVEATRDIAFECNLDLSDTALKMPGFNVPEGFNENSYLEFLSNNALGKLRPASLEIYQDRLKRELDIISGKDFSGYFLIVADIINYARKVGIPVGPGRGSACSSLVCYLTGITKIDPVEEKLMFERFLNPERVKMPDIDIDFASSGRYKIIEYIVSRFGIDNVAQILTFNHLKHKALFGVLFKLFEIPEVHSREFAQAVDKIISLDPNAPVEKIAKSPLTARVIAANGKFGDFLEAAEPLLNNIRQTSIHAGGVVIAPESLKKDVFLMRKNEGIYVTGLDMTALEGLGYLKMDLLGINALEKIEEIRAAVKTYSGVEIDIENINLGDKKTYDLISSGETFGVFQLETFLFRKFLPELKVSSIHELAVAIALIRPGPIEGNILKDYIVRKNKGAAYTYPIAALKNILDDTYGLIVFQEQVMKIAIEIFGYSYSEADTLRDIMSKKRTEKVDEEYQRFMQKAKARKIDFKIAGNIFGLISKFAQYGFNQAHSSAYSRIAYVMAYFMANYPAEYMLGLLNGEIKNHGRDHMLKIEFLRRRHIKVTGIDVNLSELYYSISKIGADTVIRTGFMRIPAISAITAHEIIEERKINGLYLSFGDFMERLAARAGKIRMNELDLIIKNGGLDSIGEGRSRERIASELSAFILNRKTASKTTDRGQITFFKPEEAVNFKLAEKKFMPNSRAEVSESSDSQASFRFDIEKFYGREILKYVNILPLDSINLLEYDEEPPENETIIENCRVSKIIRTYGVILNFEPAVMEVKIGGISKNCKKNFKFYVNQELAAKINRLNKFELVFIDFYIKIRKFDDFNENNLPDILESEFFILKNIISYREASIDFKAYIEIKDEAGAENIEASLPALIKHAVERYPGEMPLFIKTGRFRIATNKKVNFSEKFVNGLKMTEKFSGRLNIYIDFLRSE